MFETIQTGLYAIAQFANQLVHQQLLHLSALSLVTLFGAGLLTSLTPCTLSMLPITIAYLGGYDHQTRLQGTVQSLWFSLGLATTLAGLGIVATLLGRVYGQIGVGLPIAVSLVAIVMGLSLLEALPLPLPSFDGMAFLPAALPQSSRSYLLGLTFGLVASPCSTPVLATLLTWVATSGDPILGSVLLLAYTTGYVVPLVVAGTFTVTIKQFLELRQWSAWITPTSGILLVGFGVFSLLSRLPPLLPA